MIEKIQDIEVTEEMIIRAKDKIPIIKFPTDYEIKQALTAAIEASEEIQELVKQNEWQPIETAPKDKYILITGGFDCGECSKTSKERTKQVEFGKYCKYLKFWVTGGSDVCYGQKDPTHWRHIPQPPKEQNND